MLRLITGVIGGGVMGGIEFGSVDSGALKGEEGRLFSMTLEESSFLTGEPGTNWDLDLFRAFSVLFRPARFSFLDVLTPFSSTSSPLLLFKEEDPVRCLSFISTYCCSSFCY